MDQHQAFAQTLALAEERGLPELPGTPFGLEHLRNMADVVAAGDFDDGKLGRWLGWAQCALAIADVGVGLEDLKRLNLAATGLQPPTVDAPPPVG